MIQKTNLPKYHALVYMNVLVAGCVHAAAPDEYRESQRQVAQVSTEQSDDSLRVATFLRLRDQSLQDPKLFYFQSHFTQKGVQRVEKPGRLSQMVSKQRAFLYLPVSDAIEDYLFLIKKQSVRKTVINGVTKRSTEWTDWALLEIPAKEVNRERPIVIPKFGELSNEADDHKKLLVKLQSMYDIAKAAAEKKMSTPIKSRSEVPWYAR